MEMDFMHHFGPKRRKIQLSTQRKIKVLAALNSRSRKCFCNSIDSDSEKLHDHGKEFMAFLQYEQFHVERLKELIKVLRLPVLKGNVESADDLIRLVEEMLSRHCAVCAGLFSGVDNPLEQLSLCLDACISYSLLISLEKNSFQKIFDKHEDFLCQDELLQEPVSYISKCKDLLEKLYVAQPQEIYYNALKDVEMACNSVESNLFVRENTLRMLQIQKMLHKREPKILSSGRVLVKEGILYKVNQKGTRMRPRILFLFNDTLLCCKFRSKMLDRQERNSLLFCSLLPLKLCTVVLIMGSSDQGALFKVTCSTITYLLLSKIPGEAHTWFEELETAIRSSQKLHGELQPKLNRRKNKVLNLRMSPFLNQPS